MQNLALPCDVTSAVHAVSVSSIIQASNRTTYTTTADAAGSGASGQRGSSKALPEKVDKAALDNMGSTGDEHMQASQSTNLSPSAESIRQGILEVGF